MSQVVRRLFLPLLPDGGLPRAALPRLHRPQKPRSKPTKESHLWPWLVCNFWIYIQPLRSIIYLCGICGSWICAPGNRFSSGCGQACASSWHSRGSTTTCRLQQASARKGENLDLNGYIYIHINMAASPWLYAFHAFVSCSLQTTTLWLLPSSAGIRNARIAAQLSFKQVSIQRRR